MSSENKAAAEKKFNEYFARELAELREHAQQWSAEEHKRVQAEIHFERCEAAEAWCQSTWRSSCEKSHPELRRSMTESQWKSYYAMWYEELRKGFEDDVDSETYEEEQRTGKYVDWNHPPATSMLQVSSVGSHHAATCLSPEVNNRSDN